MWWTRAVVAAVAGLCCASCTLDLDRLRVGAEADGGGRDGGQADAEVADGGEVRDAAGGRPDAGCGCGGGWQPSTFDVGGMGIAALDAIDLDGDGDDDVVASLRGGTVSAVVLRMQAMGCFQAGLSVLGGAERVTGTTPDTRVAVGNWDADEYLDIAAPNPAMNTIEIYGGFVAGTSYSLTRRASADIMVEGSPALAFAVDLDGIGARDDVVALGTVGLMTARAAGAPPSVLRIGTAAHAVAFGTPDTDGAVGAIAAGGEGVLLVRYELATDTITGLDSLAGQPDSDVVDVLFVDLDGDGVQELVAADRGAERLVVYTDGGASWIEAARVPAGPVDAIASGVFDTAPQVAAIVSARSSVDFYGWSGTTLSSSESIASSAPTALALGDVDGDGRLDVVVGSSNVGAGRVTVYRRVCAGAGP